MGSPAPLRRFPRLRTAAAAAALALLATPALADAAPEPSPAAEARPDCSLTFCRARGASAWNGAGFAAALVATWLVARGRGSRA